MRAEYRVPGNNIRADSPGLGMLELCCAPPRQGSQPSDVMYEYKINDLALMLNALIATSRDLRVGDQLSQTICTDQYLANLATMLGGFKRLCESFEADPSLIDQIVKLQQIGERRVGKECRL